MKKNVWYIIVIGSFLLTACGGMPPTYVDSTSSTPEMEATPRLTFSPLPSRTPRERPHPNQPTVTPLPPTPLPTIPTFTPTFDVSTIVTATSAPSAACPRQDPELKLDPSTLFVPENPLLLNDQVMLDFLNNGGTPQTLLNAFLQGFHWLSSDYAVQYDVTRDKVDELIINDDRVVYIFGCKDGNYQTLLSNTDEPAWLQTISFEILDDMNLNGIPELITVAYGGHTYTSINVSLFEWNGQEISPLIRGDSYKDNQYLPFVHTEVPAHITVQDTDGNGTLELVIESDLPIPVSALYSYLMPWRNETDIYAWNGSQYILNRIEYSSPEFRFQALQDADYAVAHGNLNEALAIYQSVIANDELEAFSHEILINQIVGSSVIAENLPTLTPVPPDITEYPRLAAYAYYRIMLLHVALGNEAETGKTYGTLREKFGNDEYGRPYVAMATAFWDAYQSTQQIYDGCTAAIQHAVQHPEILAPLGSDYHGPQSHIYVPADVCPFR